MITTSQLRPKFKVSVWQVFVVILILLFIGALGVQFSVLQKTLIILEHANNAWLVAAIAVSASGYFLSAASYVVLAKAKIGFWRAVLIQIASAFANRLLPAGSGAVTINYMFLRACRHSADEAVAVVTVKNLLSLIGHVGLIAVMAVAGWASFALPTQFPKAQIVIIASLLAAVLLSLAGISKLRVVVGSFLKKTLVDILSYKNQPRRVAAGLVLAMMFSITYVLTLAVSAEVAAVHLSFAQYFIILTFGVVGGAVVATPGGLGGTEAALIGGMVVFGVSVEAAVVVVVAYRFVTYWLTLLIGALAFGLAQSRGYIARQSAVL